MMKGLLSNPAGHMFVFIDKKGTTYKLCQRANTTQVLQVMNVYAGLNTYKCVYIFANLIMHSETEMQFHNSPCQFANVFATKLAP